MNKIKYIFVFLGALQMPFGIASAETIIVTKYDNYKISGNNIHEIRQAILASGIKDGHGNVFTAQTNPKFTWKYNFSDSEKFCSVKTADVEVQITYHMPELDGYESLNDADKAEWERYATATYQHEQGHAKISVETAKEIEWEIMNILPKASCGEVARTANMLISNILNHDEKNNLAYDDQTGHGTTQGAVFAQK